MDESDKISVSAPWALSHYIPLNGFHPLYRALFDHAPLGVDINAWDNIKLYEQFKQDIDIRESVLSSVNEEKVKLKNLCSQSIEKEYYEYYWPPNQVLTAMLAGDIEFHHTAPYPSLKRPYIFHCESFAPIFFPFAQQGSDVFKRNKMLREYYRSIFENPLCLGIFSHVPVTLESISRFFSNAIIDKKLYNSKIGLSIKAIAGQDLPEQVSLSRLKFLFINSANQDSRKFFHRGGHIVLRFWKEFITSGREGLLMLRCARPGDEDLREYGVDTSFLKDVSGRSIIWAEGYLYNHEMNALMASAHFFLLPSSSLHSASIMQAMLLGTIPVVTDTVGTEIYLEDDRHGIMLCGVRSANWHVDANTGILVDQYCKNPSLDDSLVTQMTNRITSLLDRADTYQQMRNRAIAHARKQFSGEEFSKDFWNNVIGLFEKHKKTNLYRTMTQNDYACSLQSCTLRGEGFTRVFESAPHPVRKIFTGQSTVWELGGAFIHAHGNPSMDLNDWSVFTRYFSPFAPKTIFVNTLEELGGIFLQPSGISEKNIYSKLKGLISRALMPYPDLHSFAASILKRIRSFRKLLIYSLSKSNAESDVELVLSSISGFNIIRYSNTFYAIPQSEGVFEISKIKDNRYSTCFTGHTAEVVLRKIENFTKQVTHDISDSEEAALPKLVQENCHGFNIIYFKSKYYAISQGEGDFDYEKVLSKDYAILFEGASHSEVQDSIVMDLSNLRIADQSKVKDLRSGV